jgi:hypothetical protein
MSLNILSASLADLGRREDALAASEVALTIRRDLATQVARCHDHELEQSLQVVAGLSKPTTPPTQPAATLTSLPPKSATNRQVGDDAWRQDKGTAKSRRRCLRMCWRSRYRFGVFPGAGSVGAGRA